MWVTGERIQAFLFPSSLRKLRFIGCLLGRPSAAWSIRDSGKSYFFSFHEDNSFKFYVDMGFSVEATEYKSQRDIPHHAHSYIHTIVTKIMSNGGHFHQPKLGWNIKFLIKLLVWPEWALSFRTTHSKCCSLVVVHGIVSCPFNYLMTTLPPEPGHPHTW